MIYKITIAIIFLVSTSAFSSDICENPLTTLEISQCLQLKTEKAENVLDHYLTESKNRYKLYPDVIAAISNSQIEWIKYREAHCDSINKIYKGGTIRGIMHGSCMLEFTYTRTHLLWKNFLTYMDSTPPILPEPKMSLNQSIKVDEN